MKHTTMKQILMACLAGMAMALNACSSTPTEVSSASGGASTTTSSSTSSTACSTDAECFVPVGTTSTCLVARCDPTGAHVPAPPGNPAGCYTEASPDGTACTGGHCASGVCG
jgi:hypothetical protein